MEYRGKISLSLSILILFVSSVMLPIGKSCKDIIVTPPATAGDYSFFLKVRDPSREGLQVLCRVPHGTRYTYHHPWSGRPWEFNVTHTFIGVTTAGDVLPNIVKAGMVVTDAGLAFGDADTLSYWKNPTKNAWDDFDWLRYAYQSANNEDEATALLTSDAVDRLHAPGVTENLFIVGPSKAVVIEADVYHYSIKDFSGIMAMSNYPKELWRTEVLLSVPIASSFDATKETWVRQGQTLRLNSICGIRVLDINQSSIKVKPVPFFVFHQYGIDDEITIQLGERATIGPYSVRFLEMKDARVKIALSTVNYAWEKEVLSKIQPLTGHITTGDMMGWSRLHTSDLDGLRPLCEDVNIYETAMVYKIPKEHADYLSSGWFSANHPCASIYVPVHICDDTIYESYQNGDAASLSLNLLHKYGHGTLTPLCKSIESVFFIENELNEIIAHGMIHAGSNFTAFLTAADQSMQEQAFLTEQLWMHTPNASRWVIENIWRGNYSTSLQQMRAAQIILENIPGLTISSSLLTEIVDCVDKSVDIQMMNKKRSSSTTQEV